MPEAGCNRLQGCMRTLRVAPVFGFPSPFGPPVWKPDLHKTEQLSQWQRDEARDCLRAPLMNRNDESTLIVSSGSLIWADSFSLVYMSAYWLLENSESGNRSTHLSIYVVFCGCEACTNAFYCHSGRVSTLLQCFALLLGECGAAAVLHTFGFLVIGAHCFWQFPLTYFLLNQRLQIYTDRRYMDWLMMPERISLSRFLFLRRANRFMEHH